MHGVDGTRIYGFDGGTLCSSGLVAVLRDPGPRARWRYRMRGSSSCAPFFISMHDIMACPSDSHCIALPITSCSLSHTHSHSWSFIRPYLTHGQPNGPCIRSARRCRCCCVLAELMLSARSMVRILWSKGTPAHQLWVLGFRVAFEQHCSCSSRLLAMSAFLGCVVPLYRYRLSSVRWAITS